MNWKRRDVRATFDDISDDITPILLMDVSELRRSRRLPERHEHVPTILSTRRHTARRLPPPAPAVWCGADVLGQMCWGRCVGAGVLGQVCWGRCVGAGVLGQVCWGRCVGADVLGQMWVLWSKA
ncbi:hypothetical protein NQD34_018284 [Periophthalmus magnuspinnatus]|nr:hypothetical protein NQD34_018284 [Periophthalmus magnuspinnatus]